MIANNWYSKQFNPWGFGDGLEKSVVEAVAT